MKKLIFLLALGFLSFKNKKDVVIKYDSSLVATQQIDYLKHKKLSWDLFQKKSRVNQIAAITQSGITYGIEIYGEDITINVVCFFNKQGSYFTEGNNKPHILNHEQGHFDLTYIYTLKFINILKNEDNLTYEKIAYIYNKIINDLQEAQNKYDLETRHSKDFESQNRWDKIINNELINYKQ